MSTPIFDTIAIVGIGLIGSSLAQIIAREKLAARTVLFDSDAQTRDIARQIGLGDQVVDSLSEAVTNADLVVLCVPVGAVGAVAQAMAGALKPGAIVTDTGSVKNSVMRDVTPHIPQGVHLVPGHPIAGTEQSGPKAGFADLFAGKWCVLTPPEGTDAGAVEQVSRLWQAAGMNVELMDASHHDRVLAITSHVPHLIAYNIVGTAADLEEVTRSEVVKFAAGGFRDSTRLAASDPTMWRDVFLNNREAVLEMLGRFVEDLTALQRAIRWGDGDALFDAFERTRAIRRRVIDAGQEIDVPDFGRGRDTSEPPADSKKD
ncbi:MAG: prephenate/arogenate dehydrogenase family protein [Alphaproteobacteria bacterium]